jgi:hypothetical protein
VQVTGRTRADVACVWACLADPYSYASWVSGTAAVRAADPSWPAPGARLHHRFGPWPFRVNDYSEVVESQPPFRLVLEAHAWPLAVVRAEVTLSRRGCGTDVRLREDLLRGLGARMRPVGERVQLWRNRRSLTRLLALAESRPTRPG